jgi:hypothetical protein
MSPSNLEAPIRRRGELGASPVKVIISFVILALVVQAAVVFVPRWVAIYDFESEIEKEVRFGSQKSDEAILSSLLDYAADKELDVSKENLQVHRTKEELTVPIPTLLYTYNLQRSVEKTAPLF